jgi:selT/selW/selH-like putative selenoprotein
MEFNPMAYVGLAHIGASLWNWISDNKSYACVITFIAFNFAEMAFKSTGAFEIYFDDTIIWSKLRTGKSPTHPEVLQILEEKMKVLKKKD